MRKDGRYRKQIEDNLSAFFLCKKLKEPFKYDTVV